MNNTKSEPYFFVPPEVVSSKGNCYALSHYRFDRIKRAGTGILTDPPFKITILILKRILIEMCTRLIYKIRFLYV